MKKGLIALSLLVASNATAQTCIPKPDCADMGYTETSCSGGALKCPFDTTKLFCTSSLPPAVECDVGMIYYSNGKCYSEYSTSYGIALGIVVVGDTLVMSAPIEILWCDGHIDIDGVPNIGGNAGAKGDMNGKSNTLAIVSVHSSSGESVSTSAAMYCNNYAPTGTSAGDWYLPAAGELYSYVSSNYTKLKTTMQAMGWIDTTNYFWSSSEYDGWYAWNINISSGYTTWSYKNVYDYKVSCFLAL